MSHTTLIKSVAIRDVAAIRQAVERLASKGINVTLKENQKPRMYYANQGETCEYVVALPGSKYDLGLKLQQDGTYAPMFDEWGSHVKKEIGAHCNMPTNRDDQSLFHIGQFLQAYSEYATTNAAAQAGYTVSSCSTDKDGNTVLELESY